MKKLINSNDFVFAILYKYILERIASIRFLLIFFIISMRKEIHQDDVLSMELPLDTVHVKRRTGLGSKIPVDADLELFIISPTKVISFKCFKKNNFC